MHKFSINRVDFSLLAPTLIIAFVGLASFYSIDPQLFRQQAIFLVLSLFAYLLFLNIDYRIFAHFSKYVYILIIGSLLLLFFTGIEARGAVRWLDLFGVRIQFSEIIKPFFIIFIAHFLTKDDNRSFKKFITALLLTLPVFLLILKQPDLGNGMIYILTVFLMLFFYGFPLSYFAAIFAPTALLFPLIFNFLHSYQKERLISFLNPTHDPFGSSYNVVQALVSIGSGGLFGKGFGDATQSVLKFLPERHTDFIFATISENLGFLGAVFLLCLYGYLLYRVYKIREVVSDRFSEMLLIGFYFVFLIHIFLNIGMNIGIVPVVGITLPFASYGGSSLLTSFIILGIISSVRYDFNKRKTLEIV